MATPDTNATLPRSNGERRFEPLNDGTFAAPLPSGAYVVTLGSAPALSTSDLPATIAVTQGKTTTLTVMVRAGNG